MFQFSQRFIETKEQSNQWFENNSPDFVRDNYVELIRYLMWLESASKQYEALVLQQQQVIDELKNKVI